MAKAMSPAVKRFLVAVVAMAATQGLATASSPAKAEAQATRCPAPNSYCYPANCTGGCTTKTCNGQGNCTSAQTKECYDCVSQEEQ
jgi:hypothetical protein